ncbi:hypothetical protein [Streptomyces sp. NPDC056883]|uniref:hypothetical protein n=1 Tax=Streptomyces sp. NPDC056883 TaxID=3345959 RepID=UPI0036C607E5
MLNRIKTDGWRVTIATPGPKVTSMNGVVIEQMSTSEEACAADAVIVGSGIATREVESALHYVAPVGEKKEYTERAWHNIAPYLPTPTPAPC